MCAITGCEIQRRLLCSDEFVDTSMPCCDSKHMTSNDTSEALDKFRRSVRKELEELLCSPTSKDIFLHMRARNFKKILHNLQDTCAQNLEKHEDAISCFCGVLNDLKIQVLNQPYDLELRRALCEICVERVTNLLSWCTRYLKIVVKQNELKYVTWGLTYMMRQGVEVQNVMIVPKIPELESVLCNEAIVSRYLGFKAKNITDVENRFKFEFRSMSSENLARLNNLGFFSK